MAVGVQVSISGYNNYSPVTDDIRVALMRTDASGAPAIGEILSSQAISRYDVPMRSDDVPMFLDLDFSGVRLIFRPVIFLAIALSSN